MNHSQKAIIKEVKKEWPIKEASTELVLGMKREKYVKDGVAHVKITQGACAKGHYEKFCTLPSSYSFS